MRLIPSIKAMKPEEILRKLPFTVPIPSLGAGSTPIPSTPTVTSVPVSNLQWEEYTQDDFIRQYYPSSHKINSLKYYPNTLFINNQTGAYQAKVRSRMAVALQQFIHLQRKEALLGNNVGMRLISGATNKKAIDQLAFFREGWEDKDMEVAINNTIDTDFKLADTAVYVYMEGNKVRWRSFSYDKGDVLYPHYDTLTGDMTLLGRLYHQTDWAGKDHTYLDVIDSTHFVTYIKAEDSETWTMERKPKPHGFPECPVAYHRSDWGPVWSGSQSLIDGFEVALSQFAENNSAYALRILYTLGAEMEVMTDVDGTPSRIDSIDPNAKVGFLEPAEGADGAFAKQLEIMKKEILRGSFVVETPEVKSGTDISSRTVKMLYADSYMKALSDSMEYQAFINKIARLFKFGYFLEKDKVSDAENLKVKCYLEPFIFMSENDVIAGIQQLVAAGAMSRKTATELAYNIGYSSPDEVNRLLQEAHDELLGAQQVTDPQTNNPVNRARAAAAATK